MFQSHLGYEKLDGINTMAESTKTSLILEIFLRMDEYFDCCFEMIEFQSRYW